MLYNEFLAGTGCRDNKHNYKVYKDLEIMYMNSDMTKEDIYQYGRNLVDNSKSPELIRLENDIKDQIRMARELIKENNANIRHNKTLESLFVDCDPDTAAGYRETIRQYQTWNKQIKCQIKGLKWVLK